GRVARGFRYHRVQSAPRLLAVVVGHVPRHGLGLVDVHRLDRALPDALPAVHPFPADDLDLRDAHDALRRGQGGIGVTSKPPVYGLLAEFREVRGLVQPVEATRAAGFREIDAFTPFPVEEVSEALSEHENRLPFLVLIGGVLGGLAGYLLQYWTAVIDYPINVGGRPFHSWPAFLPITFECIVL